MFPPVEKRLHVTHSEIKTNKKLLSKKVLKRVSRALKSENDWPRKFFKALKRDCRRTLSPEDKADVDE